MGIQAHFLQDKNQEKFYPYAHADATFDKNGKKVGTRLDEIDLALTSIETDISDLDVQADWSVSDSSSTAYIKNKPTSMPASDVSAWAKASTKPSYTWSEISGKPSTFAPSTHTHTNATSDTDGFMSSEDKNKLDSIESGANKTVIDSALSSSSTNPVQNKVINSALSEKISISQKGAAYGIAELDSNGKVPSTQLPSYVDDVLDYNSQSNFPGTGESGKIYIAKDTNKTYRWSGSAYVEISASLALGETASTAYRGDRGKIAYDHSQTAHAPANAEANVQSDWSVSDTSSDAYIKNKPTSLPANGGDADTVNGHTIQSDVPANAVFTDTKYSTGTTTTAGITKLYTGTGTNTDGTMTQNAITTALNSKANSSHTHNYAGASSAGGSANSAVKLDTSTVGSSTQPVYFSGGKPVACTYTLEKSVPSNAVFTDTNTWIALKGATTSAAGTAGYAPAPSAGAANRYLRSDGTWAVPPDTNTTYSAATTSAAGLMSAADKTKLDGIATGANKYTLPTASSSTLGGVKTTSNVTSTSGLTPCPIISGVPYYKDTNTTYSLSSFGITATASELNKLDGVTATAAELNYVDGVTSNIQTQLNNKADNSVVSDEVTQSDINALFS